jgi:glucose-1-phosphate adenylyltransferase
VPEKTIGLVLGGGRGERLFPLTMQRSKPAVPFAGKYRLVDVPISNCINGGIRRIFVLTQFNSASLHNHISRAYRFDSFGRGFVDILAAEQTLESKNWYQGTADAVRQNLRHILSRAGVDRTLILSGDQLYRMNLRELVDQHKKTKAEVTVAVTPVPREEASRYGILKIDESQAVTHFVEKPNAEALAGLDSDGKFLASMGIYLFDRTVLEDVLLASEDRDFGHHILPRLLGRRRLYGYPYDGYFEDVGTIRSFYNANLLLTEPLPRFNFYEPLAPIYTDARFLPGSKIDESVLIRSLVTEGCILNRCRIERSIIGIRSRIERDASVKDSIVMGADYYQVPEVINEDFARGIPPIGIGEGAVVERAIIDKNARVGRMARIVNRDAKDNLDAENYFIRDGIVCVPKDAVIPDRAEI